MRQSLSGIYEIRNTINDHTYIGQSMDLAQRKAAHWRRLRRDGGAAHSPYLQNAWNKYGESAFQFNVLAVFVPRISKDELTDVEQDYVDFFLPQYNVRRQCVNSQLGIIRSKETRAKISAAGKGRKHTPEARAKIGKASRGNKYALGQKASAETRKKMSDARRGRPHSAAHCLAISKALRKRG